LRVIFDIPKTQIEAKKKNTKIKNIFRLIPNTTEIGDKKCQFILLLMYMI